MLSRSLGHRAPLLWLALPFMAGLAAGRAGEWLPVAWALTAAAALAIAAAVGAWRDARIGLPALGAALFFAGLASYALHRPRLADWDVLPPREARVSVGIERSFPQTDPRRAAGLAVIVDTDDHLRELRGQRVYFSAMLRGDERAPIRSAVVALTGVLESLPRDPPNDTFEGYLANAGINFRLTRARVRAEERPASAYFRFCARRADEFSAILGAGIERKQPQLAATLRAMLLGQQHELSEDQKLRFRQSGTMHIFSISGLHIAAIAGALHALLALLRLPRGVRFVVELTALWLYVDITGTVPSAVRAFGMVALVETALLLRVARNPIAALAASALIVLLAAPLQLFSASFQMSYGIVAALLLLGLPLADSWNRRFALFEDLPPVAWRWHHRWRDFIWRGFLSAVAIGVAASLVSAVSGVTFFKLVTPGGLLANLWLVPASTGVLMMGVASLLCGLVGFAAGSVLANHAALVLLWLMEQGIRLFVGLPGMWHDAVFRSPWIGGLALVALLGAMAWGYARGWQGAHRFYWTPFAVVAAALLLGAKFG